MYTEKYTLDQVLTIPEAAELYNINLQTLKNKMKPSVVGEDQIAEWTEKGLIRRSGRIWLITREFVELHYKIEDQAIQ